MYPILSRIKVSGKPGAVHIRHINWRPVDSVETFGELLSEFEPGDTAVFDVRLIGGMSTRIPIVVPEG